MRTPVFLFWDSVSQGRGKMLPKLDFFPLSILSLSLCYGPMDFCKTFKILKNESDSWFQNSSRNKIYGKCLKPEFEFLAWYLVFSRCKKPGVNKRKAHTNYEIRLHLDGTVFDARLDFERVFISVQTTQISALINSKFGASPPKPQSKFSLGSDKTRKWCSSFLKVSSQPTTTLTCGFTEKQRLQRPLKGKQRKN